MAIHIDGRYFKDEHGRILNLRGVNLGGSSKVPKTPDGATHINASYWQHRNLSFVGRPFPLAEADEHFARLRAWGLTFLRFIVTWEAIEHDGPGQYDQAYLEYVRALVDKAAEYDISLFIDPHQDVWSRFTGGDGAPGWTLELAGFDLKGLRPTAATLAHQTHGDPYPTMLWPSNTNRLATMTLFTLFFAGKDFAPDFKIDGQHADDYLQGCYFAAMQQLADKLNGAPNVVGYGLMNEPSAGLVGKQNLAEIEVTLRQGLTPTPFQAMALGCGHAQTIKEWQLGLAGPQKLREIRVVPDGASAWRADKGCIWQQHGVWAVDAQGQPQLLQADYFAHVGQHRVDFVHDYLTPFVKNYAAAIRKIDPDAIIFIEGEPIGREEPWPIGREDIKNIVFAPHWYDGLTLFTKRYFPFLGFDVQNERPVFGAENVRRSFTQQIKRYTEWARDDMGDIPVMITEIGIPFDMNKRKAYRTGDFSAQIQAMDTSLKAVEHNLIGFTLWNYTADNSNGRGDQWNGEDLSIFSRDQQDHPDDIHSGGRALEAVVRPYARATAGEPLAQAFDVQTAHYTYTFRGAAHTDIDAPTEFFVPNFQYPQGYTVEISDGRYEIDAEAQRLLYWHERAGIPHTVRIIPTQPRAYQPQPMPIWLRLLLILLGVLLLRALLRRSGGRG
jgi:hypothetical protein